MALYGCGGTSDDRSQAEKEPTAWERHDRSRDWTALKYGRDVLDACEPDAVLFTRGDNDTYPLWYLQVVEGYRRDVIVANLSLLNAPWYIKQLRDQDPGLPIELNDSFIDRRLTGGPASFGTLRWPSGGDSVHAAGISWRLDPDWIAPGGEIAMRSPSQWMVAHLIDRIGWSRPIYFTIAPSQEDLLGLSPYLSFEGVVYRLKKTPSGNGGYRVDTARLTAVTAWWEYLRQKEDAAGWRSPDTQRILGVYDRVFRELNEELAAVDKRIKASGADGK